MRTPAGTELMRMCQPLRDDMHDCNESLSPILARLLRLAAETSATVTATTRSNTKHIGTTLKSVGQNESRRELEVTPSADEIIASTSGVIFRVHVEERESLDTAAIRVLADGAHIMDPDPGAIVGLEHDSIFDVQVMVNGAVVGGLEGAGPLGLGEVAEVDDVSDRDTVFDNTFHFVKFVVQKNELMPVALRPPALVCVGCTGVLKTAKHL